MPRKTLVSKPRLVWVEKRTEEPGEPNWHCLMEGHRRVMLVRPRPWGSWWWYGLGHSSPQFADLSLEAAKAQAEALATRVLGMADRLAGERAEQHVPGPSVLGEDG